MHVNVDCIYIEHNFVLQEFKLQDIVYMALQKGSHQVITLDKNSSYLLCMYYILDPDCIKENHYHFSHSISTCNLAATEFCYESTKAN